MREKIIISKKIIKKPYNIEILELCNGKYSILDMSKLIGLTYKSIFLRLNDLIMEGIVIKKSGNIGENSKLYISEQYKNEIENIIAEHKMFKKVISDGMNDKDVSRFVFKILNEINNKRYLCQDKISEEASKIKNNKKKMIAFAQIMPALERLGYTKTKVELTKKGKKYIKTL